MTGIWTLNEQRNSSRPSVGTLTESLRAMLLPHGRVYLIVEFRRGGRCLPAETAREQEHGGGGADGDSTDRKHRGEQVRDGDLLPSS
jgi:hypothetical protein